MAKNSKKGQFRRFLRAAVPVLIVAIAGAVVAIKVGGDSAANEPPNNYVLAAAADPADGPAYVHEAIANVRGMERFRFTQTVAGVARQGGNGTVDGEVDLSQGASDPPKLRYEEEFTRPNGGPQKLDSVTIGDQTFIKGPGKPKHEPSTRGPKKSKGKAAGGAPGAADVVDPVMSLLEAVDLLPDDRFGTPSAPDGDGIRTVVVNIGSQTTLTLSIDDAERLIRKLVYTKGGVSSTITLSGFGDTTIQIRPPAA